MQCDKVERAARATKPTINPMRSVALYDISGINNEQREGRNSVQIEVVRVLQVCRVPTLYWQGSSPCALIVVGVVIHKEEEKK